ncbi:hypothetical protein ACIPWL_17030 [Streptomyces sp. NPDC090023]
MVEKRGEPGAYLPGTVGVPGIGVYGGEYPKFFGGEFREGASQNAGTR